MQPFVDVGCVEPVAHAAREFQRLWKNGESRYNSMPTRSGRSSLYKLVARTIWPPWERYVASLPPSVRSLHRTVRLNGENFKQTVDQLIEFSRAANLHSPRCSLNQEHEFYGTLSTVRSILECCEHKQVMDDATRQIKDLQSGLSKICAWRSDAGERCKEWTEFELFVQYVVRFGSAPLVIRPPSPTFCNQHSHSGDVHAVRAKKTSATIISSDSGDVERWHGHGLCRFCGKLTERDALLAASGTGRFWGSVTRNRKRPSPYYCADHRPPAGKLADGSATERSDYRRALRHSSEFLELVSRLQRQTHLGQKVKDLHPSKAVNRFENEVVRRLGAHSLESEGPEEWARRRAKENLISFKSKAAQLNTSEALAILVSSIRRSLPRNLISWARESEALPDRLKQMSTSAPSLFRSTAVLACRSEGMTEPIIADLLCVPLSFVARTILKAAPTDGFSTDERRIRRAAYDLIAHKMTDPKKEIVAHLAQGRNQSEAARIMGIRRQVVSRMLKSIPMTYRFDLQHVVEPCGDELRKHRSTLPN